MKYFNQNNYPNSPYPSPSSPKATIKSGGCGATCMAMIVSNMTNKTVDPPTMGKYAIQKKARVSGGTDMNILAKAICQDYDLTYKTSNDENELIKHLKSGGLAIANVGGNRQGYIGVFSDGGHYVVVATTSGNKVSILDPGYYPGKFNRVGRKGKVLIDGNFCVCDISVLAHDTMNRNPGYYLFSRVNSEREDDELKEVYVDFGGKLASTKGGLNKDGKLCVPIAELIEKFNLPLVANFKGGKGYVRLKKEDE